MSSAWQFLDSYFPKQHSDEQGFWHSGQASELDASGNYLYPLGQYGLVAVEGPDSSTFLQGQTSCDWRQITQERAGRGSYCNIKGRVLHSFVAGVLAPQQILLRMRADTTTSFCQTLAKYIVFSKAKMRELGQQRLALGLNGPKALELLQHHFDLAPEGNLGQHSNGETLAIQLDEAGQRFECWLAAEQLEAAWPALLESFQVLDSRHWERLNIQSGIGEVCAATQDMFIPQMLNMQLTGAVSFKKGCYTGQEVIARMEYRGKLKRRMYRAQCALTDTLPPPGTEIYRDENSQSIGNIVTVAPSGDALALLAVLSKEAVEAGDLHIGSPQGPPLHLQELPYNVPEKE